MSHLRKITKFIVNIFTFILFILLVLVLYGKLVVTFGDNKYPNYFGYTFFEVASGSMEPTLYINDVILVKVTKDDLKKNDIIAFYNEDTVITHRILFKDGDIITVKGDNNNVVDEPININQVIGKVVDIFPKMGIWKKVLKDPKILFVIFITLLLFDFALSYNGNENKKIEELLDLDDDKKVSKTKKVSKKEVANEEKPIAKQIPSFKDKEEKKEKVIESEELLELTRKIDIDEINKLLEGTEYKLEKKEINNIKKELGKVEENALKKEENIPKLNKKERKALEYTLRLDLDEIQKRINNKIN